MKEHKYAKEIDNLKCTCPPTDDFSPADMKAYRWVHSDFNNSNNFLPVLKINPNRLEECRDCKEKCMGYGISLYDDLSKAEKKLKKYLKRKPKLVKIFGDSIAEGNVNTTDGLVNIPNSEGHFTLHEDKDCNLKAKFVTLKQIKF